VSSAVSDTSPQKVSSRANNVETIRIEETHEYRDACTQHDAAEFVASSSTQTDPPPVVRRASFGAQTAPPPARADADAQTAPAPVRVSGGAQTDVPKGKARDDLPPAYNEDERVQRAAAALLAKTRPGADAAAPLPAGAPAAWAQLQRELGASCVVLDGLVAAAPLEPPLPAELPLPVAKRMWTRTPFSSALAGTAAHVLLCMGASEADVLVLGPARVPGGAGAYDRLAWESFNALGGAHGEGFDGTNAVWGVVSDVL
jgi:hypothetical protein